MFESYRCRRSTSSSEEPYPLRSRAKHGVSKDEVRRFGVYLHDLIGFMESICYSGSRSY